MPQLIAYLVCFVAAIFILRWLFLLAAYFLASLASRVAPKRFTDSDIPGVADAPQPASLAQKIKPYLSGLIRYMTLHSGSIPFHAARIFTLRHVFNAEIAESAVVYMGYEMRSPHNIRIGKGTIIGNDAKLDARYGITIGSNVNFSTGVWIWTQQHDPNDSDFASTQGSVHIGDRAWISSRVTILPGVTIGEGAVIAAGAVVTKNVEPYAFYGGIPAKKIGERNRHLRYTFDGSAAPFY